MYEIAVEGTFSAAHRHAVVPGGVEAMHGHDFRVLVHVAGADLVDDVLVDFHDLELRLKRELSELHYRDLSTHEAFADGPATPARLARWLYGRLAETPLDAGAGPLALVAVEVRDSDQTGARYSP